jgi:CheY-like chemotaxis protein
MSNELILVVDDSEDFRETVVKLLNLNGFSTCVAADGHAALRQVEATRPDLMLLDLQMERMNGVEVIDRLNHAQVDLPIIVMTAHGNEGIAVDVFRKGVKDYIIKGEGPNQDDILAAIQRSLVAVRLRREKEQLAERLLITNFNLQQRVNEFKILHSIGKSVASLMDIEALLLRIVGAATMLTQSMEGSLYLMERKNPVCRAVKNEAHDRPQLMAEDSHDPVIIEVAKSGKAVLLGADEGSPPNQSAVVTPLAAGEKVLGVLAVRNNGSSARVFGKRDMVLMSALADYAAIALENANNAQRPIPAARPEPSMMEILQENTVFISYSRTDWGDYVESLVTFLNREGFKVWVDQNLLLGGEDWLDKINEALAHCTYMVLCVSPRALASPYVKFEYRYFFHHQKPLIPLICEPTLLPAELLNYHNLPHNNLPRLAKLLKEMMSRVENGDS